MGTGGKLRANLALSLASVLLVLVVIVVVYEAVAHVRYSRWRSSFDNEGWIGHAYIDEVVDMDFRLASDGLAV